MTHMGGVAVGVIRAALRPLAQRVWGEGGLALQLHTHVIEQVQWPSPSCCTRGTLLRSGIPSGYRFRTGFSSLYLMSSLSIES